MRRAHRILATLLSGSVSIIWMPVVAMDNQPQDTLLASVESQNGLGPQSRKKKPLKWIRLAAESGDANAAHELGVIFTQGDGVPCDYLRAIKWYLVAAKLGHAKAQNNLGVRYDRGEGVSRDIVRAYAWFSLAADQGHETAKQNLEVVTSKMTSDQITAAKLIRYTIFDETLGTIDDDIVQ